MIYEGKTDVISGLRQKNNGNFPIVHASAVQVGDNKNNRLDAVLDNKQDKILISFVDQLPDVSEGSKNTIYMIPNESGTNYTKWWLIEDQEENLHWDVFGGSLVEIVEELPQTGDTSTDYYLLENGVYLHYRYIEDNWELVGSNSYSKDEMNDIINELNGNIGIINTKATENSGNIGSLNTLLGTLQTEVERLGTDNTYYLQYNNETNILSLMMKSRDAGPEDPSESLSQVTIVGGGGGAGADVNFIMTYMAGTSSSISTIYEEVENPFDRTPVYIPFTWSCKYKEGNIETGPGTIVIYNNNVKKTSMTVQQGDCDNINIAPYLTRDAKNTIRVVLTDINTQVSRTLTWIVNVVSLKLISSFDASTPKYKNSNYINFNYTLNSTVSSATMHYIIGIPPGIAQQGAVTVIDGVPVKNSEKIILDLNEVKTNFNGLFTYAISTANLSHRAYSLDVYAETVVNNINVYSNVLHYEIICAEADNDEIIVTSSFNKTVVNQYEAISIPYLIWNPNYSSTYYDNKSSTDLQNSFQLQVYDITTNTPWNSLNGHPEYPIFIRPDNSLQFWSFVPSEAHNYRLRIVGHPQTNVKIIQFTAIQSNIAFSEITDGLIARFTTDGKDNSAVNYNSWTSTQRDNSGIVYNYNFTFPNDFDWVNGGWKLTDEGDNSKVLTIKANNNKTRLNLPLFEDDNSFKNGKTIKLIFKAKNCINYETPIIDCYQGDDSNYDIVIGQDSGGNDIIVTTRNGRGLKVYANKAIFDTANEKIEIPFREDSKIEMDIVVYPMNGESLILIYLNGIASAVHTYQDTDNFSNNLNYILFGSTECDVDVYLFKLYNRTLTPFEILNNYVMDAPTVTEKNLRYVRNNIFNDEHDAIDVSKLTTPYMIITVDSNYDYIFPTQKLKNRSNPPIRGDIEYFDPSQAGGGKNWICRNAGIGMQGTSSAAYGAAALNLDIDLQNGLEYANGVTEYSFKLSENSLPVDYFNLKVDVASSEGANNVLLTDEYNLYDPYISDPQLDDLERIAKERNDYGYEAFNPNRESNQSTYNPNEPKQTEEQRKAEINYLINQKNYKTPIRGTIEGKPITVFYRNLREGENPPLRFYAKANLNNSKNNFEVFGENNAIYPRQSCVEFLNNSNPYCSFKTADFSSSEWEDGLQFRYPKNPSSSNINDLARVFAWVVSTDPKTATGNLLPESVFYNGNEYTRDTANYRYAKFKNEIHDYFILDSLIWIYLFTEFHLMVDNRAKNIFMSTDDGIHWHFKNDYDNDTALGIDNQGRLKHGYNVEYNDGSQSYAGEDSVLWNNLQHEFFDEIMDMYNAKMEAWNASRLITKFENYQAAWPEAIWNEDMFKKYINSYLNSQNRSQTMYLGMLLGNKALQRVWFLSYREIYMSSKYDHVANMDDQIYMRTTSEDSATLSITPYIDMYINVRFGGNDIVGSKIKAQKGIPVTVQLGGGSTAGSSGTEAQIHFASVLNDIGDLSPLLLSTLNISQAKRLRKLILGSQNVGYYNTNWTRDDFLVFNSALINEIDLTGVSTYQTAMNLSNCTGLKKLYLQNTLIPNITLPKNTLIEELKLPITTNRLNIVIANNLELLSIQSDNLGNYSLLESIIVEKVPENIDQVIANIILKCSEKLEAVRLIDMTWSFEDSNTNLFNKLKSLKGIDQNGNLQNNTKGCLTGITTLGNTTNIILEDYRNTWGTQNNTNSTTAMIFNFGSRQYTLIYKNEGKVWYSENVFPGDSGTDPMELINTLGEPTKASTGDYSYEFLRWENNDPNSDADWTNVTEDRIFNAVYNEIQRSYNIFLFKENYNTVKLNPELYTPDYTISQGSGTNYNLINKEEEWATEDNLYTGGWTIVTAKAWNNAEGSVFPQASDSIDFDSLPYYNDEKIDSLKGTTWCFLQSDEFEAPETNKKFGNCTLGEINYVLQNNMIGNMTNWLVGDTKTFELNLSQDNQHESFSLTIINIDSNNQTIDLLATDLSKDGYYYNKHKKSIGNYTFDNQIGTSNTSKEKTFTCLTNNPKIEVKLNNNGIENWDGGHPLITTIKNQTQNITYSFNNGSLPNGLSSNTPSLLIYNNGIEKNGNSETEIGFVEMLVGSNITVPANIGDTIIITTYLISEPSWNSGGWYMSDLRASANSNFYNLLPLGLRRMIVPKTRISAVGNYVSSTQYEYNGDDEDYNEADVIKIVEGNDDTLYIKSYDKIWIPSNIEVDTILDDIENYSIYAREGSTFSIFTNNDSRKKNTSILAKNQKCKMYFLSTPYQEYNNSVGAIDEDGNWQQGIAAYSILPCAFGMTLGKSE